MEITYIQNSIDLKFNELSMLLRAYADEVHNENIKMIEFSTNKQVDELEQLNGDIYSCAQSVESAQISFEMTYTMIQIIHKKLKVRRRKAKK
ncbi:MAG: hypothetical protein PHW35_15165 [Lentimicrobiaceae bacterium]|jgi:hypothetical protein|nr:hypothetical protein [Lentimicrobiaceae bacterium]MDD4599305.1 hypothetical protein [Lentimicrobiaceae bacterium]MDY0027256.1 hypothetical protein [Lentimicrobium sp.]